MCIRDSVRNDGSQLAYKTFVGHIVEQQDEFVSAVADDTVAVSMFAVVLKYLGNGDDGSVSGIVPVRCV